MVVVASEVDQVAADVSPLNEHVLAAAFRARAANDEPEGSWQLLASIFDIHLRPSNPDEPFGPMIVMEGRRSMVPSDLSDDQIDFLRQLLDGVVTPALRCRLGDVLWTARRDGRAGSIAVSAYIATGVTLEDPNMWPPCMECYERAVRLARSLGRKSLLFTDALQHLANRVVHYGGEDRSFFTSRALTLLEEFRFGNAAVLSGFALTGAKRRNAAADPYAARIYWDIAAKLLSRAGLANDAEEARIESAQTWVTEADQAETAGNHMAAQSHLDRAIQAYRTIPGCKHLLPHLHRRLDAAGAEALKLMRPISSAPIDIEPLVRAAQESVRGLSMSDAINALACAAPSMDPDRLRSQVTEATKTSPLASMFTSVMYDRAGRVVHKTPGLFTDDPDEREQAFEAQVSRQADLLRHLTVSAQIGPALMALLGEHTVEEADLMPLLEGSVLVPVGRQHLFAMGLAAGFRRDMVTAMHLLVPQLENALRTLLRDAGTITASIDQDGIQSDWPLGRLLSQDVIRPILPETLIFELRSLLIFKGSSNIRNKLCHGLLDPDEFGTANVVYTWWLLLKISLHGTPGFQAWVDERLRNDAVVHHDRNAEHPGDE